MEKKRRDRGDKDVVGKSPSCCVRMECLACIIWVADKSATQVDKRNRHVRGIGSRGVSTELVLKVGMEIKLVLFLQLSSLHLSLRVLVILMYLCSK